MLKKFVCIVCPNGCEITAEVEDGKILSVEGATCKRGEEYVESEITNPMRNVATSLLLKDGELPLAPVRLDKPIPKAKIFEAMEEIHKVILRAPVHIGDVAVENVCGCGCNAIVTKEIKSRD